jgi:hypothetical protein
MRPTASAFNRFPSVVFIVFTLPRRLLYCVSKCSLLSLASSSSSLRLCNSSWLDSAPSVPCPSCLL